MNTFRSYNYINATNTIYMISSSSTTYVSLVVEDPPNLSRHHFHDDEEIFETATDFTPFRLVYGVESILPIEFQISSPRLVAKFLPDTSPLEEPLLMLK